MAQTVSPVVNSADRERLAAVVEDRNRPQKHVQRARIILLSAERLTVLDVAASSGVSRPSVWRWQQRFAEEGVEGLLRDKTRKPGKAPLPPATIAKVLALPCGDPPKAATHWTGRMVAKVVGVSLSAVQRIWEAHRLQPHRIRTFKKSTDPAFAAKIEDIVGLYMHPPKHAIVVSIDEKSQIQALDRTQPGLPLKPGRCGTMTHDYKRHGTITLFAALNYLDGKLISRTEEKHSNVEWLRFLKQIERETPKDLDLHLIVDNYGTHKHQNVKKWLASHQRFHLHFTPTGSSWMNLVERFFADLSQEVIRDGSFANVGELTGDIESYMIQRNLEPKPYRWKAKGEEILRKIERAKKAQAGAVN